MFQDKKHLFFDLDHTLWDFEANAEECLDEIYEKRLKNLYDFSFQNFYFSFSGVNKQLWRNLEQNKISHEYVRKTRFQLTLQELDISINLHTSNEINSYFLDLLPSKTKLIPDAKNILVALKSNYQLHILTNGFQEVQVKKLKKSGIHDFFEKVISNDLAMARKPDKAMFQFALDHVNSRAKDAIMIGDSYDADILGAKNAGIDSIHFSSLKKDKENMSNLKIDSLKKLLPHFKSK